MRERRITVEIGDDGTILAEAEGFSGDTCLGELERLLDGLAEWESVRRKPGVDDHVATRTQRANLDVGRKP